MSSPDQLPRYQRPVEPEPASLRAQEVLPPARLDEVLARSSLSEGSRLLLRGLIRLGRTATFCGGGIGLDYAGLLKSAVRPDVLGPHVQEAAVVLKELNVDMLVVPGMSGYPVGTMYALESGIPALLLRKEAWQADHARTLPPGAFILPSYTSAGEVLMTADPAALLDITRPILQRQLEAQAEADRITLSLRIAGADDIIDKATMARAATDSSRTLGRFAVNAFEREMRAAGEQRPVDASIAVATWVTPLLKQYNRPEEHLVGELESPPFAGLRISGVYTAPRAIGIDGVGILAFEDRAE